MPQNLTQIATGVETSEFGKKYDTASLKSDVDKLDIDKLRTIPNDLSKISDAVETIVVKKTVHDKKITKVYAFDTKVPYTSGLVSKTQHDSDE